LQAAACSRRQQQHQKKVGKLPYLKRSTVVAALLSFQASQYFNITRDDRQCTESVITSMGYFWAMSNIHK
jgi:hypothetical protein